MLNRRQHQRIRQFIWNTWDNAILRITTARPIKWLVRRWPVRLVWRIVYTVWYIISRYIWWPVKRQVRRLRRGAVRRDAVIWAVTWGICGWIGWAILFGGFLMGLMIGLMCSVFYVVICLRSPLTGLMIWLLTSPFLTMYVAVRPLKGLPMITGDRYCIMVLFIVYLVQSRVNRREGPRLTAMHFAMVAFIVAMFFAGLRAKSPKDGGQVVLDTYAVPFLMYLFARRWITDVKKLRVAFACLMIVGFYFSAFGVPEYFTGKSFFSARRAEFVESSLGTIRARGPAESPSEFGLIVLTSSLLAVAGFANEHGRAKRSAYVVVTALGGLALACTLRRSIYVSLVLAMMCMLMATPKTRRVFGVLLAIGACCLVIFWNNLTSSKVYEDRIKDPLPVYQRLAANATSWEMIKARPWFGVGIKNYAEVSRKYLTGYKNILPMYAQVGTTHNAYLRILTEGGLISFVPYLLILVMTLKISIAAYRRSLTVGLMGRDGVIVFIAFWIALTQDAVTDDIFWFSHYATAVWFFYFGAIVGVFLDHDKAAVTEPAADPPSRKMGRLLRQAVAPTST